MGAVAVAAVGGVAASTVRSSESPTTVAPTTAAVAAPTEDPLTSSPAAVGIPDTLAFVETDPSASAAHEYVAAIQAWADCVAEKASAHTGGRFDPDVACPGKPQPPAGDAPGHDDLGPGNSGDAPGHDDLGPGNSEDAPGHDDLGPGNSEDAPGQNKPPKEDKPPREDKDK
jgi:hypothetical protein